MLRSQYDHISGVTEIKNYHKRWKEAVYKNTGIEWGDTKGDVTGKILYDYEDDRRTSRSCNRTYNEFWDLTLNKSYDKIADQFTVMLKIKVCPSKIFYRGKNHRNIPLFEFNKILIDFANKFSLNLLDITITGIVEASSTAYPECENLKQEFIKERMVRCDGKSFDEVRSDKTKKFMGLEVCNSHATDKLYLPGIKFGGDVNSVRIERAYNRVQTLTDKTGIRSFADLIKVKSHYEGHLIVLDVWDKTIIIDPKLRQSKKYSDHLNEMIYKGKSSDYWLKEFPHSASDKTKKKWLNEYRDLSFQKGTGLHTAVRNCLLKEGIHLRKITYLLQGKISELDNKESYIKDCKKNNIMKVAKYKNDTNIQNLVEPKTAMSKKHTERYMLELKQIQYTNFMSALKVTLALVAA